MNVIHKLTWSYIRHHPARLLLTCVAIMASACMVVWVVSGYDSLLKQFKDFAGVSAGRYTLMVYPARPPQPALPGPRPGGPMVQRYVDPEMLAQLRADPDLLLADPMWSQPAMVMPYNPATFRRLRPTTQSATQSATQAFTQPAPIAATQPRMDGPRGRGRVPLVGIDAPLPPYAMARGRWLDLNQPEALEGVLSVDAADRLGVDVGGEVSAGVGEKAQKLTIIGIVDVPVMPGGTGRGASQMRGPASGGLYVTMKLAEIIQDRPAQITAVGVVVKPGAAVTKFRFGWQARFDRAATPLQFQNAQELEEELDASQTARNMQMQAYSATGIALLAALFIIFATLNMGVSERARQFAVLRAVALTRSQIAALIFTESMIMAVIGWVTGIGAGWALLWIVGQAHPALLGNGAWLGEWSLLLSGLCAFGGALCAAVVPALRAMRLRPLDAMAPRAPLHPQRGTIICTLVGLVLIALNPLLTFVIPMADEARYALYMALGCVSMAVGFILVAPVVVLITERIFGPILCLLLGLEYRLLKSQLSSNLWRTVGTVVALTIGLGLFVSMQVWGYTMLRPFEPGPWVPDAMLAFLPRGLPIDSNEAVARLPGLRPGTCLPLAVEQPKLTDDITGSELKANVVRQDNIVLIGLDPQRGLGGTDPLLRLDWVAGSPATAIPLLQQGRHCIVPDHFCRESKLKLGDTFRINAPSDNTAPFTYTIAGIVRLPGWHWISKFSGVRLNNARSSAMVFAGYDTVAKDFKLTEVRFYWTALTGTTAPLDIAKTAAQLAQSETDMEFGVAGSGFPQADSGAVVRITTPVAISQRIRARADGWIWSLSQLPLVTLAVASLGVLNAIMASVRARTWDFGVMRSLGFTRWTLMRLIITESILVGLVACLLSLGFGIMAGWCGAGISQYVSFFGGLQPDLVIPWGKLSVGLGSAVGLCLLAGLWPALSVDRTEPLRLLQAGRSAL